MSEYFEYQGQYYLTIGLLQLRDFGLLAPGSSIWEEPTQLKRDVLSWLEQRNSKINDNPLTGLPTFVFPDQETLLEFTLTFDIVPSGYDEPLANFVSKNPS